MNVLPDALSRSPLPHTKTEADNFIQAFPDIPPQEPERNNQKINTQVIANIKTKNYPQEGTHQVNTREIKGKYSSVPQTLQLPYKFQKISKWIPQYSRRQRKYTATCRKLIGQNINLRTKTNQVIYMVTVGDSKTETSLAELQNCIRQAIDLCTTRHIQEIAVDISQNPKITRQILPWIQTLKAQNKLTIRIHGIGRKPTYGKNYPHTKVQNKFKWIMSNREEKSKVMRDQPPTVNNQQ
jgi:hypothetical protein